MQLENRTSAHEVRSATALLNRTARRLRDATDEGDWSAALLDGAAGFCGRAMVFLIEGEMARMVRAVPERESVDVPLDEAPALAEAVRAMEPLIAVWSPAELSPAVTKLLGLAIVPRVYLFPVLSPTRTVALLMAEGEKDELDVEALELLSILGGSNLNALTRKPEAASAPQLIHIQPAVPKPAAPTVQTNEFPDAEERHLHLRAQRFARVRTAEMQLYQSALVQQGRSAADLYGALRDEIDRARRTFREQFLNKSGSMADYLHDELVRTLANENPALLGNHYPGPLA